MRFPLDIGAALRAQVRRPGFVIVAAAMLGIGIGVAAAMVTLVRHVVLAPLPVAAQDRLVVSWGEHRTRDFAHFPYSYEAYERVLATSRGLTALAATDASGSWERLVEEPDGLVPTGWSLVLGDFAGVLGIVPAAGRGLTVDDDVYGVQPVAMISWNLWQRRWNGSPSAIGSILRTATTTFTVVGVMPHGFDYPRGTDVWSPHLVESRATESRPLILELDLIGRLRAGASAEQVRGEIESALVTEPVLAASEYKDVTPVIRPFADVVLGGVQTVVRVLFAAGMLLLLVALFNASNLVVLRTSEREQALAVRRALGATATDLAAVAVAEAVPVAALAAAVAAIAARIGLATVPRLAPAGLPRLDTLQPDAATWVTVALVSAATLVLLAGVSIATYRRMDPSLHGVRGNVARAGRGRWARGLVAAQAALALWAAVGALLLVQTMRNLRTLDPGFEPAGLYIVHVDHSYPLFRIGDGVPDLYRRIDERLARVPGITAASPVLFTPLAGNGGWDVAPTLDAAADPGRTVPYLSIELPLPGYFEMLGMDVVRGRTLLETDAAGAQPVVFVNEAAARVLWPGQPALGQRIKLGYPGYSDVWFTVAGVVADTRYRELLTVRPAMYVSLHQLPVVAPRYFVVRTSAPVDLGRETASVLGELSSGMRVVGVSSMSQLMDEPLVRPRFALSLLGLIAAIVLGLAGVGVYGLTSASVRSRTRELGIRVAVGARASDLGTLVLREAALLTVAGGAAGAAAAVLTGRFVASLLFGIGATNATTYALAIACVTGIALLAGSGPALRAARTDPMTALRTD